MWKTVLILIFTIIVVPITTFYFDDPLAALQQTVLNQLIGLYLALAILCYVVSSLSKNYSQVDKLWSVAPIFYVWIVAWHAQFEPRILLMAVLATIWGVRLTYNFSRRGGYHLKFWEGVEDYRWAVLQARPEFQGPMRWTLFNLFFISLYQMGLILLFTLPILKSMNGAPLGIFDILLAIAFLAFVIMETVADQQQWTFQNEKHRQRNDGITLTGRYAKGFVSDGLWGITRHPNYTAEQSIWVVFYLFSVVSTGFALNWSIAGCLLLLVLFKGSSDFSEEISASKYPEYKAYQQRVGRFLPKLF